MIKISIIIPHKNSSSKLFRLLKTIPDSDHYEIIIVDDASEKEEKEKLNSIKKKNARIIHSEDRKGAGAARNIGLKEAKGKWLLFADADDYFAENMENLLEVYLNTDVDIVYFRTDSFYEDTKEKAYRHKHPNSLIDKYLETNNEKFLLYGYLAPWSKLINATLVKENNILFEEIVSGNDMYFSMILGSKSHKIEICDKILYNITVSSGSITTTFNKNYFDSRFHATLRCNKHLYTINESKYQLSVLYFLGKSYHFGVKYAISCFIQTIKMRSNPFKGISKILRYKKVLQDRQNPKYLKNIE